MTWSAKQLEDAFVLFNIRVFKSVKKYFTKIRIGGTPLPPTDQGCNGSIFLTVPVPVLELVQVIWRSLVRF